MKIELEYPYNKDWKFGYLQVNGEGRNTVILFNNHKDRSSTSYARCLMSVKLGRYLTDNEEVDHIDCNKFDDRLDNLQILTISEHKIKTANEQKAPLLKFICACCGRHFERSKQRSTDKTKYYSVDCSQKMAFKNRESSAHVYNLLLDNIELIRSLIDSGSNDKSIGDMLGVGKMSVYSFRKKNGILVPREKNDKILLENSELILKERANGSGSRKIAKIVGVSRKVIERFLKNLKKV